MASCTCAKPPALKIEEARLKALGGTFLGICGDINHDTGFHLPGCALKSGDYSRRYGVGNPGWAAAIDVGMNFAHSRDWLVWLVAQATAGRKPGLCEIIGKPAGKPVLYWAKWHDWKPQTYTGVGHDTHSHLGCERNYLANAGADLHLLDWSYTGGGGGGTPTPTPTKSPEVAAVDRLPTLKRGAKSTYVRNLQGLLVANGRNIKIDGDFGPATDAAVLAEQREYGIAADKIVGAHTWATLISRKKS